MPEQVNAGWCGVILPDYAYYQGFFIPARMQPMGAALLADYRAKFGGRYLEPSVVERPTPGVAAADQAMLGALSAALVEVVLTGNELRIGAVAAALMQHAAAPFYFVIGTDLPSGIRSEFGVLDAATIDAARDVFRQRPEVMLIDWRRALDPDAPRVAQVTPDMRAAMWARKAATSSN